MLRGDTEGATSAGGERLLASHVEDAERQQAFVADALAAEQEVRETGSAYLIQGVSAHLLRRARGEPSRRPKASTWPR